MGEVIHAAFGQQREWEIARETTLQGFLSVGRLFGDDETLLRAKSDLTFEMLRHMVEGIPNLSLSVTLPQSLTDEQQAEVLTAVQAAAATAIEHALDHAMRVLMTSIYDLCTSKLRTQPPEPFEPAD